MGRRTNNYDGVPVESSPIEKINQQMKDEIIEFILNGYSLSEITDYLQLNYDIKVENARRYYRLAHMAIMDMGDIDPENVIMQHVFYYEEAIRYFDSIANYSAKAVAMNAKEKLLKIFEEDEPAVEIENNVNIDVEQLNYDIEELNSEEKKRFNELFNKVKLIKGNRLQIESK